MAAQKPKFSGYRQIIHEATGQMDEGVLRELEKIMRHDIFHSTLDWQTREMLNDGAREAVLVLKQLQEMGYHTELLLVPC